MLEEACDMELENRRTTPKFCSERRGKATIKPFLRQEEATQVLDELDDECQVYDDEDDEDPMGTPQVMSQEFEDIMR